VSIKPLPCFSQVTQIDVSAASGSSKPQLSRREREEIDKVKAKERYQKLHAAGKTEEARSDLARLAIIKKQREDASKKRDEERLGKSKKSINNEGHPIKLSCFISFSERGCCQDQSREEVTTSFPGNGADSSVLPNKLFIFGTLPLLHQT
jgi:hypothetical protein